MLDHEWGLLQREAELRELDGPRAAISTGLGHSFYLSLMPFTVRIGSRQTFASMGAIPRRLDPTSLRACLRPCKQMSVPDEKNSPTT